MKKILAFFPLMILSVLLLIPYTSVKVYAKDKKNTEDTAPRFSVNKKTLYENYKSYNLMMRNIDEDMNVTFASSDKKVARVNSDGKVTPVSEGTAVITATITREASEDITECTIDITVKKPYYEITASTEGVFVGGSFHFSIRQHGYSESSKWTLVGSEYASLTPVSATECIMTGISPGTATVTVESLGVSHSIDVRIYEGKGEIYVVDPDSKPLNDKFTNYKSYNKYTKNYYVLRSYLERLEKCGGGMLVLKAGTYNITNILCIPSNTTVLFHDGVVINKSYTTNTSSLIAHRSIFHTVSYSNYSKTGAFTGYDGEHDINIIGEGTVIIDMKGLDSAAIVSAHCQRLLVSGIQFLNMNTNHFIELDASSDVTIVGNLFKGYTESSTHYKEAINLDTPDSVTKGFKQDWSSYDATPNRNVTLTGNTFIDLEVAIGTHKYTEERYHDSIVITDNYFHNMHTCAIRPMNWTNTVIKGNSFYNDTDIISYSDTVGILLNGVLNPTVTLNRFENYVYPVTASHWKNSGSGKSYAAVYCDITDDNILDMQRNYLSNVTYSSFLYYTVLKKTGTYSEYMIDSAYLLY